MVYLKVPQNARPGQIIGLNSSNTYTTCRQCGREIVMTEPYFVKEDHPNFYLRTYICMNCEWANTYRDYLNWVDDLVSKINAKYSGIDNDEEDFDEDDMEDDEDE